MTIWSNGTYLVEGAMLLFPHRSGRLFEELRVGCLSLQFGPAHNLDGAASLFVHELLLHGPLPVLLVFAVPRVSLEVVVVGGAGLQLDVDCVVLARRVLRARSAAPVGELLLVGGGERGAALDALHAQVVGLVRVVALEGVQGGGVGLLAETLVGRLVGGALSGYRYLLLTQSLFDLVVVEVQGLLLPDTALLFELVCVQRVHLLRVVVLHYVLVPLQVGGAVDAAVLGWLEVVLHLGHQEFLGGQTPVALLEVGQALVLHLLQRLFGRSLE